MFHLDKVNLAVVKATANDDGFNLRLRRKRGQPNSNVLGKPRKNNISLFRTSLVCIELVQFEPNQFSLDQTRLVPSESNQFSMNQTI